jgi:hypothetical protein
MLTTSPSGCQQGAGAAAQRRRPGRGNRYNRYVCKQQPKAISVSALTQLEAPLMLVEDCESEEAPGQPVVQYTAGQSREREREPLPQVTDQPDQAVHVAQVPAWAARGQQKSQRHF